MPRTNLREAREAADLSQEELATRIGAEKKAVSAWETGAQRPQPGHRRAIRDTLNNDDPDLFKNFESAPEEANEEGAAPPQPCHVVAVSEAAESTDPHENEEPAFLQTFHEKAAHDTEDSTDIHHSDIQMSALLQSYHTKAKCDIVTFAPPSSLQSFFVTSPINRLLCIAHTDYSTPHEMTHAIQIAIQDFDTMNLDPVTRREALTTLAALPIATLGQKQPLRVRYYEETLRQCAAALEGCWELYRGSDASGTQHAFDCVCTYVPTLEAIAKDSNQHRKEALDLATRYALLKTLLGWACVGARKTVPIAQEAHSLSRASQDILLQASACTKLGWAYSAAHQPLQAYQVMQQGEEDLKRYRGRLPSHVIGNFNSTYALVQAKNGLSPNRALGIATDSETGNERTAFIVFTESAQCLEAAHTCSFTGDSTQAMIWIGKRMNIETFEPHPDVPQSERGRIEAVNVLVRALLQSKERDMERIIFAWKVGMEGAQTLRNQQRYNEAMTNFEIMKVLYPGEQAIRKLIPLTEHWSM